MRDGGYFILFGSHDEDRLRGPGGFVRRILQEDRRQHVRRPFPEMRQGNEWMEAVNGKRVFLMGRSRSLKGYREELTAAGFRILYCTTYRRDRRDAGFLMRKDMDASKSTTE